MHCSVNRDLLKPALSAQLISLGLDRVRLRGPGLAPAHTSYYRQT